MVPSRVIVFLILIHATLFGIVVPNSAAQVVLTLFSPQTNNFPLIDIAISVTENGAPATLISGTNFAVSEDGIPSSVFGLNGCGGTSSAAIAFVVDTSLSMDASLGTGVKGSRSFAMFDNAVSRFLASIPGPSALSLVPFADTATYWYPGKALNYYTSNFQADTTAFMQHLDAFRFTGNTDVDYGLDLAAQMLSQSTLPRRIIILVTDDAPNDEPALQAYLQSLGINLYVMDVSRDLNQIDYADQALADSTAGAYLKASDTTLYLPSLIKISQLIFGEHCILQYKSELTCPEWAHHNIQVTLNYRGTQEVANASYDFGRAMHDVTPPRFTLYDTSGGWSAKVSGGSIHAYDPFPCQSGLVSLVDSAFSNFSVVPTEFSSDSAIDALTILDTLHPADAYFIAIDSAGNIGRYHVHYNPQPDVNPPIFEVPIRDGASYTVQATERQPWDRGIDTVYLDSGANNLALDSVVFFGKQDERLYLRIVFPKDSARGCVIAIDSVGNRDTVCIEWDGDHADTLPPIISQNPVAEPHVSLSGIVTEERLNDIGIRKVIVTPLANTSNAITIYDSIEQARVSVSIIDSLFPAFAKVEAYDSANNYAIDTLRFGSEPDTNPPIVTSTPLGKSSFVFLATDTQAWDRGVAFLTLLGTSANAAATPAVFADGHHAAFTVTVTDRTLNATIIVQATDSAGHHTTVTIDFAGIPLIPLGDSVIDFGVQFAPANITRSVTLTNQNDIPVVLNIQTPQGDASDFTLVTSSPVTLPAFGSQTIAFTFNPSLIGGYNASSQIQFNISVGSITLIGRTIGAVELALDTVHLRSGDTGTLHLSVDVSPKPSNLDTISFTLTYDANIISLGAFVNCSGGSPDTGACAYDAFWSGGVEGNKQGLLVRNPSSKVSTLSFRSSVIDIPFQSYVSTLDTTVVHISALDTFSSKLVAVHDGLVLAGDSCEQPFLRDVIIGEPISPKIISVTPNPAQTSVTLNLYSAIETDCSIKIISIAGIVERSMQAHLNKGEQQVTLKELPASSGTYEVVLSANGVESDRTKIEIVR